MGTSQQIETGFVLPPGVELVRQVEGETGKVFLPFYLEDVPLKRRGDIIELARRVAENMQTYPGCTSTHHLSIAPPMPGEELKLETIVLRKALAG